MGKWFSRLAGLVIGAAAAMAGGGGCSAIADWTKTDPHRFLSPDQFVEPPERSPINPILNSISLVDQTQELVPNATFPTEGDWEYVEKDYVIGPTDVVDISIMDLFQEGLETLMRREVSDTGFIDLPLLSERIKAEGKTQGELTAAVVQAFSPNIIRNPTVTVTVVARRQNTYYILGAIAHPSQYMIGRRDMRLLEAVAIAGGVAQNNIQYLYVIRPAPAVRKAAEAVVGEKAGPMPEVLPALPEALPEEPGEKEWPTKPPPSPAVQPSVPTPAAPAEQALQPRAAPQAGPASAEAIQRATEAVQSNDIEAALRELGQTVPPGAAATQPRVQEGNRDKPSPSVMPHMTELAGKAGAAASFPSSEQARWVYRDGKWVRASEVPPKPVAVPTAPSRPVVEVARPIEGVAGAPAEPFKVEDPFGWRKASKSDMARIIAINLPKLNDGDPRQNIVIRDNDIIHIPYLPVGEFYVTGEVLRPGVYALPSTPVTIKQALSAAGNVSPLAWPENSVLIRRIGASQEQTIPLNVEAVFMGREPDLFLKPNDIIAVGTDVRAPFFAVLRNAFRMTYGFGFIYDRNFADPVTLTPKSNRFTRW
jgi:protein involved in polysaccharide export with SLBB domain